MQNNFYSSYPTLERAVTTMSFKLHPPAQWQAKTTFATRTRRHIQLRDTKNVKLGRAIVHQPCHHNGRWVFVRRPKRWPETVEIMGLSRGGRPRCDAAVNGDDTASWQVQKWLQSRDAILE